MSKQYIELPKKPTEMSAAEIGSYFGDYGWSVVMRSILMWEIKRVRKARANGDAIEQRTLRGLWYQLVKPALSRWGALEPSFFNETRVKNAKDLYKVPGWDGLMSKYLAELVREGITSYEELNIIDGSRQRRGPMGDSLSVNSVDTIGPHYPNVLLFTEKDTIYSIVENIAAIYGVGVLSGSGKPSLAATENLIRQMVAHENFKNGSDIYILTMTDYDPSGYIISESAIQQVGEVSAILPQVATVRFLRLGLMPNQLGNDELQQNVYTPAKAGLDKWFEETGGVNGEPLGLELDALPLSRIRELFVNGIEGVITDETPYHEDLARSLIELLVWEALEPTIEAMRSDLWKAVDGDALAKSLKCDGKTLGKFAKAGFNYVNPLDNDEHIFGAADRIREKLQQVAT